MADVRPPSPGKSAPGQPVSDHPAATPPNAGDRATIWTERRKWMGNLIPMTAWLPFTGIGIFHLVQDPTNLDPIWSWLLAGVAAAWLMVNFFGLFENGKMQSELRRKLEFRRVKVPADAIFVGMSTPSFSSLLDTHEDVGFLAIGDDAVEFMGEHRRIRIGRDEVRRIRSRANIHTFIGLGGWICIDGVTDGKAIRLQVEPRVRSIMIANVLGRRALRGRLETWFRGPEAQVRKR
ncbi:MAG: hypothetical protein SFX74_13470 [Fimbriimonadaceae bacterium]|nr:hypothetical protein [Fimbriimonadaceae bacterium]